MTQANAVACLQQVSFDTQVSKLSPHYRMTAEMARWEFEQGMSTVKGYLYHLIKSSRKDGHKFRIKNIKDFCKENGFSSSAYYKAIAELKAEGLINFEIHGSMDLWIPEKVILFDERKSVHNCGQVSTIVDTESKIMDTPSTIVDTERLKVSSDNDFSNSSDLLQSSYNSSTRNKREREEKISKLRNPENKGKFSSPDKTKPPIKLSDRPPSTSEWDRFSAPGRDPDFFEFVVKKTALFPTMPADARSAAEGWIRSHGTVLYCSYLEWQQGQKRAAERIHEAIPVETVSVPMVEPEPMTPQMWVERYQRMWMADEGSRQYIRKAITQHPERGVCLGENGPELAAEEGRSLQKADFPLDIHSSALEPILEPSTATPEDCSDVLVGIDFEIHRLGWSASQLNAHLHQTYGKQSRQQLTDQELLNLLFCLQDKERLTG